MRSYCTSLVACTTLALVTGVSLAGGRCADNPVLWDNDLVPNGFNGRAISPPVFPLIRVTDDFTIPASDADGWDVEDLHATCIEDAGWVPTLPVEVYIYNGTCPGQQLRQTITTDQVDRHDRGFQLFGRQVYLYDICFPSKKLLPGTYNIGHRWPQGGGAGTNYWLTSNGGAGTARTGCFSLDSGSTWVDEGAGWHHAFTITGVRNGGGCTPCQEDIDKDCDVDFQDLLHLLAAWGPCPGAGSCDEPGNCDIGFPTCAGECFCFSVDENEDGILEGFCGQSVSCAGLTPCPGGESDCPSGFVCQLATCCGENICVSEDTECAGAGPARQIPSGTLTTTGIAP
jgi:hypothetical protein